MKILVIGTPEDLMECRDKFGNAREYSQPGSRDEAVSSFLPGDVIFDFTIHDSPGEFAKYARRPVTVFLNTCMVTLSSLSYNVEAGGSFSAFGFNGLRSMLNRKFLEVSLLRTEDKIALEEICDRLNTSYLIVDDRVGLVTPRVVCMIINEAYFTVQEGTATKEDIDLAMKLGTNYPFGPFEWCRRIGVKNVYKLLRALYDDTQDERYKVCPLLKKEVLKNPLAD